MIRIKARKNYTYPISLNRSENEVRKLESELLARRKEFEGITERIKTSSRAAEELTKQMQDLRDEVRYKFIDLLG